jgi:hypothetical protein
LTFWAAHRLSRYLARPAWPNAVWFGVVASLALLTKGHALILAPLPVVGALLSGKARLLRKPSFWLAALVVLCLAGPWYLAVPNAQHESVGRFGGAEFSPARLLGAAWEYARMLAFTGAPLAFLGICLEIRKLRQGTSDPIAAVLMAMCLGGIGLALLIDEFGKPRILLSTLPALIYFAAAGMEWLVRRLPLVVPRFGVPALALAVAWNVAATPPKPAYGYDEAAGAVLARPEWRESVVLISSDSRGEGALVSEIAMRERRPGHIVLRGTKVLARSNWTGDRYRMRFADAAQAADELEGVPVGVVVVDTAPGRLMPHTVQLLQALRDRPDRWQPAGAFPARPTRGTESGQILVYRLAGHEGRPRGRIRIDMRGKLKRYIGE